MTMSMWKYVRAQSLLKQKNATVQLVKKRGKEDGETKRVPRLVQMCIHEYLVHPISNKSETILTSILSIIQVFLYIYFDD